MLKIDEKARLRKQKLTQEDRLKEFERQLLKLYKTCKYITSKIREDERSYPIFFMNQVKADFDDILSKIKIFAVLYAPYMFKTIKYVFNKDPSTV